MSNHLDPMSNPLNLETIQEIDNLDLSIMQKHHLRILAHCLQILKIVNVDNSLEDQNKNNGQQDDGENNQMVRNPIQQKNMINDYGYLFEGINGYSPGVIVNYNNRFIN